MLEKSKPEKLGKKLEDFLIEEITSYCRSKSENFYLPKVIFLPIHENVDIQTSIQSILKSFYFNDWLIFSTYGSFNQKNQSLYPILQIIREMLHIDMEIIKENEKLPKEDRLPQYGNFIIPEFLQSVPKIKKLYKLIGQVVSKEEEKIFNFNLIYETILEVFSKISTELFQITGMIFIYNQLNPEDIISLKWLKYSACENFKKSIPLIIITCYSENLTENFIENWPKSARYSCFPNKNHNKINSKLKKDDSPNRKLNRKLNKNLNRNLDKNKNKKPEKLEERIAFESRILYKHIKKKLKQL